MVLGQRQTALVAKQARAIDVLSNGRMRLGIGAGWNAVEYEALAQDFSNRGRRMEEQMEVLRALWTQESVTYGGPLEHHPRGQHQPAAGAASHPHLDRGTG